MLPTIGLRWPRVELLALSSLAVLGIASALPAAAQTVELRAKSGQAASIERQLEANGQVRIVVQYTAPMTESALTSGAEGLSEARTAVAGALTKLREAHASSPTAAERHNLVALDHLPFVAMTVTREELQALAKDSRVVRIWESSAAPVRRPRLGAAVVPREQVVPASATGKGQLIAVLSAGIDGSHPAIKGSVEAEFCVSLADPKKNRASLCPGGKQIAGGANSAAACQFAHDSECLMGTAVASAIVGNPAQGASGSAPEARLIAVQVYSRVDDAKTCQDWGLKAPCVATELISQLKAMDILLKASTEGMKGLSAVTTSFSLGQFKAACDDLPYKPLIDALRKQGVAFVASSGDEGSTEATSAPGCVTSSVTVGAVSGTALAPFSNMAGWVDMLAPGAEVAVAIPGGKMVKGNSTLFAAAHVAGAFAAIRAERKASIDQIEAALKSTGVAVQDSRPAAKGGPAGRHAAPMVRIDAALAALGGATSAAPPPAAAAPPPQVPVAQPQPQPQPATQPPRPAVNCADPLVAGQSAMTSGTNEAPACK